MRTIPQRVDPRASEASFSPGGVWEKTALVIEATMGMTMSDTTMPAMKNESDNDASAVVWKMGIQPRCVVIQRESGTIWALRKKKPQMPNRMLGMAARRSIIAWRGLRRAIGAYSAMYSPTVTPMGMAIDTAIKATTTVPKRSPTTPIFGGYTSVFQAIRVKNDVPSSTRERWA